VVGEWKFAPEDCAAGVFPNSASSDIFGGIARNGSSVRSPDELTACVEGRGVVGLPFLPKAAGVSLGSTKTMSHLIALAPAALSFEVWATFNATDEHSTGLPEIRPLLMLGQDNAQGGSNFNRRYTHTTPKPHQSHSIALLG